MIKKPSRILSIIFFVIGAAALIGGIIFWFTPLWLFPEMSLVVSFILGTLVAWGGFLLAWYGIGRMSNYSMKLAFENVRFNFDTGVLYVAKREPVNATPLRLEPIYVEYYKHHAATIEYNSATVGGVTVGGVHVNPAHNTTQKMFSGKYALLFSDGLQKKEIKEIVLTPELLKIAEQSPKVKWLLYDGKIQVMKDVESSKLAYVQGAMDRSEAMGRSDYALNALEQAKADRGVDFEKGNNIISWIQGVD